MALNSNLLEKTGQAIRYGANIAPIGPRYTAPVPAATTPKPVTPATPVVPAPVVPVVPPETPPVVPTPIDLSKINVATPQTADQFKAANGGTVDENAIREQVRRDQQARIDATNAVFDSMAARETVAGDDRSGQTRALNSRGGTLGQDFGNAQQAKTTNLNNDAQFAIAKQRGAAILEVFNGIDKMASDKIKAQKDEAVGNAKAYQEYLTKEQEGAKKSVETLGANGATVKDLKEKAPDKLAALLKSTGYDEFSLEMALDNSRSAAEKYSYSIQDGVLIGHRTNAQTGLPEVVTKPIPGVTDGKYKQQLSADGKTVLLIPEKIDSSKPIEEQILKYNSDTVLSGAKAPTVPKPIRPLTPTETKVKTDFTSRLNKVAGQDTFVSPQDYLKYRAEWQNEGHNVTAYDSLFSKYRNPNNPNYITTKIPVKKTTAEEDGP